MVECIYPFRGDTIYQPEGYWINHICTMLLERKSYDSYCSSTPRYSYAVMLCFPHFFPGNSIYCSVFLLTGFSGS
jgi:hypothetical protein